MWCNDLSRKERVAMFRAQNIVKNFGQVKAVDGVSFAVAKPEMIGIIGRSGAGKSTLLRVINRLTDATLSLIHI